MADTKKLMNLATLTYYDNKLKNWVTTQIDGAVADAISALGNVFTLLGSKESVEALPADGNNVGDIWLVPNGTASDEYYWTADGKWELMGTTATDISGCVTKESLYAGADGTGTTAAPAEGTILASILAKINDGVTDVTITTAAETSAAVSETVNGTVKTAETTIAITTADGEVDDTQKIVTKYIEYGAADNAKDGLMTATQVAALEKAGTDIAAIDGRVKTLEEAQPDLIENADIDNLFAEVSA